MRGSAPLAGKFECSDMFAGIFELSTVLCTCMHVLYVPAWARASCTRSCFRVLKAHTWYCRLWGPSWDSNTDRYCHECPNPLGLEVHQRVVRGIACRYYMY